MVKAVLAYSLHTPSHRGKWRVVNALVDVLRLKPTGRFIVSRSGLNWSLSPEDYVHRDLFWVGDKDHWEMYHLQRCLSPGATVFDVGANFGFYSLVLAKKLGPGSRVFSFDPNPATFRGFEENILLNAMTNVFAYQLGLSDTIGSAGISTMRSDNSGASFLTNGDSVSTTTLDTFCREHPEVKSIDAIKVDIEGYEERFLKGGLKSLERFKPFILMELSPVTLPRAGSSVEKVVSLLRSLGYQPFEIHRDKLIDFTGPPKDLGHVNVLCVHPEKSLGSDPAA